jgi:glycosyltransferase involved in cell wall biosynthesis
MKVMFASKPVYLKVVAAIPCFNNEAFITDVVSKAKKYVDEVIVVNDGSSDRTAILAEDSGAFVVNHQINQGYGGAIQSCLSSARLKNADVLVTIDGDGQHCADEIPKLLNPIFEEGIDLVIGSRALDKWHDVPFYRKIGISFINDTWNFGSRVKVTDTQSGFRAYSKKAIDSLTLSETGMGISIEILEEIRRKKLAIREVPIRISYQNNNSKIGIKAVRHGFLVGLSVIRIRMKNLSKS